MGVWKFKQVVDGFLNGWSGYGWRDLTSELFTRGGAASPSIAQFRNGIYLYAFPSNQMKEVFVQFHIDHDYKLGSNLYPHIHWAANTTTATGNVRWGFEYSVAKGHGQQAFGATTIIYSSYTFTSNQQYIHHVSEVSDGDAISGANIEPDSVVLMRIFRDVDNDNFADTVFGITADIHYQADRYCTKNKAPNFYV